MLRQASLLCTALMIFADTVCAENLKLQLEAKANYRDSEDNRFATKFPFPPSFLPVGQSSAFLETVDAGSHYEISLIGVAGIWDFADDWSLQFKLDGVDRYDRNPTSQDHKFDMDNFILRYGQHFSAMQVPEASDYYLQVGKFSKFERQQERRTESYGLLSTAFNRFEDSGIEAGFDLSNGFYSKLSLTTGNPLFIRDANALAGDNGTDDRRVPPENPDPNLKSGIVLLYDAEIEDFDLSAEPEVGAAIGYRWNSADGQQAFDVMAFGYQRDLAENRKLHGTFYGADLDLLDLGDVPGAAGIRLPVSGNNKEEKGANVWYKNQKFALFGQYVSQDIASLDRDGFEIELSYVFDLPLEVMPVVRYSEIDNKFIGAPQYPAPSVWWDWQKVDYGVNIKILPNVRVIAEYADNKFRRQGKWESNNEFLVTFIWQLKQGF